MAFLRECQMRLAGDDGRQRAPELRPEFRAPGFHLVRWFLLLILATVGLLICLALLLGWRMGMEVTVEGEAVIEPAVAEQAKSRIAGIIREVHVRPWQKVAEGDLLVSLDGSELRGELRKLDREIEVNRSRRKEVEIQIQREQDALWAELRCAKVEIQKAGLQLEQVRKEYELYYTRVEPSTPRRSVLVSDLLPVRLREKMQMKAEAERERILRRLDAVEGRNQEIRTLDALGEKLEEERRLLARRLSRTVIRAPVGGTVLTDDLERRVGDYVQAGEPLLELAEPGKWRGRVMVREIDIPRVRPGQGVRLYVNAFPHMEYRIFDGTVDSVPEKPSAPTGADPEPLYPVKVSIPRSLVSNGEHTFTLTTGMRAQARITVERGRVAQLLWRKLLRTAGKAARHDLYLPNGESENQPVPQPKRTPPPRKVASHAEVTVMTVDTDHPGRPQSAGSR
jgi:membrane fusion protein (multidrug efflux system)